MERRLKEELSLSVGLLTKARKEDRTPQLGETQDANKNIHDLS